MTYQLIPVDLPRTSPISLHRPVLLIGRHPECDVRIDLPKISRRHCCVALAYDRVLIRDLGSHNGVRINGRPVEEAVLRPGDEVAIGPFIYRLELEGAPRFDPVPVGEPPAASSTPSPAAAREPRGPAKLNAPAADAREEEIDLVPLDEY